MGKIEIRQLQLKLRNELSPQCHADCSRRAQSLLERTSFFAAADVVALYSPVNNEVATRDLHAAAAAAGKRVCYPKVVGEELSFVEVGSLDDLTSGAFGVLEPTAGRVVEVDGLDLVVVPGVAFDRRGYRLGYGKGFYDRFLATAGQWDVFSVGLAFGFQLCEELPVEKHDRKLAVIVTEERFIPCRAGLTGST